MAKPRILVVEDHPTTARALTMYLETQGFAVKVAERFGLVCDVFTSAPDALHWLTHGSNRAD